MGVTWRHTCGSDTGQRQGFVACGAFFSEGDSSSVFAFWVGVFVAVVSVQQRHGTQARPFGLCHVVFRGSLIPTVAM